MTSQDTRAQVDRVLDDALRAVSAYVDLDEAAAAIQEGLQAVRKQLAALNGVDYTAKKQRVRCPECKARIVVKVPWKPEDLARASSHSMKVVDMAARLAQFAKGMPDSRPDAGGSNRDLLSLLTPDQLATFEAWLIAAQARG